MEYPKELHNSHSDYPLAPENVCIDATMLSSFTKTGRKSERRQLESQQADTQPAPQDELRLTLSESTTISETRHAIDKDPPRPRLYPVDMVDALHIIQYRETQGGHQQLRKILFQVTKQCDIWKNNGKSSQQSGRTFIYSATKKYLKYTAKPHFHAFQIFDSIVAMHLLKTKLTFNRPIYTGFAILDLSKTIMYDFHYDYIRRKFPDAQLLFTYTDSLCYEIVTDDVYADMLVDAQQFDTSD